MKHSIESIAEALRGHPSSHECDELTRACEPLRVERRARLREITPIRGLPFTDQPAGYRSAILTDPQAPGKERERLLAELEQIDALGWACSAARETALDAEARAAIPKAGKRLPALVEKVRHSLSDLQAAVGEVNEIFAVLGEYPRLPGKEMPLNDAQLAAVLELRNELWQPLRMNVLTLPDDPEAAKDYPLSWELSYERRGGPASATIVSRKPPRDIDPFQYSSEPSIRIPHARKRAV